MEWSSIPLVLTSFTRFLPSPFPLPSNFLALFVVGNTALAHFLEPATFGHVPARPPHTKQLVFRPFAPSPFYVKALVSMSSGSRLPDTVRCVAGTEESLLSSIRRFADSGSEVGRYERIGCSKSHDQVKDPVVTTSQKKSTCHKRLVQQQRTLHHKTQKQLLLQCLHTVLLTTRMFFLNEFVVLTQQSRCEVTGREACHWTT